jgi:protease I
MRDGRDAVKKKALILTWSGFQDQEVIYPYYRLIGEGFETVVIADKVDVHGRVYGIGGIGVPCQILFENFKSDVSKYLSDYDLLILPGGVKALEKLRQESKAIEFISAWNNLGKVISSTCHGAQLMISSKIVKGRKIAGYYSLVDDITNAGAIYSRDPVVVDSNIVSSPHYDFMGEWMELTIQQYYLTTKSKDVD